METVNHLFLQREIFTPINITTISYESSKKELLDAAYAEGYYGVAILTSDYGREEFLLFDGGELVSQDIEDVIFYLLGWEYGTPEIEDRNTMYPFQLVRGLKDKTISLELFMKMFHEYSHRLYDLSTDLVNMYYTYKVEEEEDFFPDWDQERNQSISRHYLSDVSKK